MVLPATLSTLVVGVVASSSGSDSRAMLSLSPAPSLALVYSDRSLNTTASIIERVVSRKSGCGIVKEPAKSKLTLTLEIDSDLGPEAYSATFDGERSATVRGGDRAGVTYGAGAFLRSAQFTPVGLIPPQHAPPSPAPPPPPPPIPIGREWWAGEANRSYAYGACGGNDPQGCPQVPLLGLVDSLEECKQLCVNSNITHCTSCGWIPNDAQWSRRCYGRHDGVWNPSPVQVPGAAWARRFKIPLPPAPPPPLPPAPGPPPTMQPWTARGAPAVPGSFRGLYFATHFGNFFANAPATAIHEYLEDMALWGANTLVVIAEPAKFENITMLGPLLDRNAQIGAFAQSIGFKVGWIFNNEGFQDAYHQDEHGNYVSNISFTYPQQEGGDFGTPTMPQFLICPHNGLDYLKNGVWGPILRRVAANGLHLDHLIAWPYDWGGCGCQQDWPWGAVGFPRFSTDILTMATNEWGHAGVEGTLSTWHFQMSTAKPPADEYGGLDKWLRSHNDGGVAAHAHAHTQTQPQPEEHVRHADTAGGYGGLGYSRLLPRDHNVVPEYQAASTANWTHTMSAVPGGFQWIAAHGKVGGLPTLDFPEYSMFSGCPWGGYGANPVPQTMQTDWDTHGDIISGGMPYSEGIYLDMNQVMRQQQYWSGRLTNETLLEYNRYEFGWAAAENITQAVRILETTLGWEAGPFPKGKDLAKNGSSQYAFALLNDAMLSMTESAKASWRWRILYLRAQIDALSFRGKATNAALLNASFDELAKIYHVESNCCHPDSPADCTDAIDTQANCTMKVLRPGFSGKSPAECSDVRLKKDVATLGRSPSGVPLFSWRYKSTLSLSMPSGFEPWQRFVGTTAQALLSIGRGDAVLLNACGGYHAVDYSRIDVDFGPVLQ
eukprot:COSAG02_NODE_550_length_20437_cov_4.270676_1_plen_888_part_00